MYIAVVLNVQQQERNNDEQKYLGMNCMHNLIFQQAIAEGTMQQAKHHT